MEIVGIVFLFFSQQMRITLGQQSNKNENKKGMAFFLVFSVCMIGFYLYYGFYTTFVLVLDIIFGSMGLFFVLLEIILSLATIGKFGK